MSHFTEPLPDVVLLRRRDDYYAAAHPTAADAFVVVEVSDTSADYNRSEKLPRYAEAGIPELWLIDIPNHGGAVYAAAQPPLLE